MSDQDDREKVDAFMKPRQGGKVLATPEQREAILKRTADFKERGIPYPFRTVDDLFAIPSIAFGRAFYDPETLEGLRLSAKGKARPVALPEHFVITGNEQLPGENRAQFLKYQIFRDLGPDRSLNKAAKEWGRKHFKAGHSQSLFTDSTVSHLASRFRWRERVAAYDAHMEIEARRAQQSLLQDQLREEVVRRKTYLDNEWDIVEKVVERLREMLELPVIETESDTQTVSADGKTIIHTTIWRPARWTYASMAQMISEVAKIGRLHVGLSTSNAAAKIDIHSNTEGAQHPPMSVEDEEMHQFCAMRAEEAYFAAMDEWKARKTAASQPQRIQIEATSAAAD